MTLSCPQPDNYAAIAKQLHETALQAEQRIYELEYQLRAAANRPTIVQTTTALQTGINAASETAIGPTIGVSFTTAFNNTIYPSGNRVLTSDSFVTLGEGVYEVGFTGTVVASGAATADSYRIFRIQQHTADPAAPGTILTGFRLVDEISHTLFESNTGLGVDVAISGQLRMKATDRIWVTVLHNNATSLNLSIGSNFWVSKVSDLSITAVL